MIKKIIKILLISYIRIRKNSNISFFSFINNKTKLEGFNTLHSGSVLSGSTVGFATYVGVNSIFPNCKIGRYCSIAHNVEVISYTHPSAKFVSTHPSFYSLLKQSGFTYAKSQLFNEELKVNTDFSAEIGNDVWIGANVMIIGGVKIGDGSIIAAGSVVTKDVPPYAIYGGVPAKLIRMRFSELEIKYLIQLKWWEKDSIWLKLNSKYFSDIKDTMNNIKL